MVNHPFSSTPARPTLLLPPTPPASPETLLANRLAKLAHDVRAGRLSDTDRAVVYALLRAMAGGASD